MPDYLERVVLAGARTSTPAKPLAAAPPRMPGVSQPWFPPTGTVEPIDIEEQPSVPSAGLPLAAQSAIPADAPPPEPLPELLLPEASGAKYTHPAPFAAPEGSPEAAAPVPQNSLLMPGKLPSSDAALIIRAPTALRPMLDDVQNSPPQEIVAAR